MPTPATLLPLMTPVLSSVIRFEASVRLAVGVKVAVQVTPPSLELTVLSVPPSTVRSLLSKPVTASENVTVTSEVSPMVSALSATMTVALGPAVATS